ncbi:helix-turn-helix domain-containing protein [Cohnella sp. 56]|uniref:helix-turn-helix domain-containing protein n=1 Tax=Cohnella sp. 56 TaxID=3113722 RepID=UPI0030E9E77B
MTIFVRDLSSEEGNRLLRIARKGADPVEVRRALLILASAQKMKVPEISLYHISGEHIRKTILRFNTEGMASLKPNYGGGRLPPLPKSSGLTSLNSSQGARLPFYPLVPGQTERSGGAEENRACDFR